MRDVVVLSPSKFGNIVNFSANRREIFIVALGMAGCPLSESVKSALCKLARDSEDGIFFYFISAGESDCCDCKKIEENFGLSEYPLVVILKGGKFEKTIFPKEDDIKEAINGIL